MVRLRHFNKRGLDRFSEILDEIRDRGDADLGSILYDDQLAEQVKDGPEIEIRSFENRREVGEYLYNVLSEMDRSMDDLEQDPGLWAWLAALWMDSIAPLQDGKRPIGATPRWIPAVGDWQTYYRHLLAGPFQIYRTHKDDPDRAMAVLATGVGSPGEAAEQLAARQEIVSNGNLLGAATRMYFDADRGVLKRGAGGKGPGSPRRLAKDMLEQFTLTWDLYGLSADRILGLLPREFDRFRDP